MSIPKYLVALIAMIILSLFAFGSVIPGEFISDDNLWAQGTGVSADQSAVVQQMKGWVFRPLQSGLMELGLRAFGANPSAWHVMSIMIHALNGFLLYVLLGQLASNLDWRARIACCLLFLLHPAGSEAVFWISGSSELTVTAWMLVTLCMYVKWRHAWTVPRLFLFGAAATSACLFKETAIALPLIVFSYEITQEKKSPMVKPLLVLLAVTVGFLALRHLVLGDMTGKQPLQFSPGRIVELSLSHLGFLWWPAIPPFALRPPELPLTVPMAKFLAPLIFALTLLAAFFMKAPKPLLVLGFSMMVFGLWPAFAVAMVSDGYFNGRQAYLPSAGLPLIAGAVLINASPKVYRLILAVLMLGAGWMWFATSSGGVAWRSPVAIYQQSVTVSPAAAGPRAATASALADKGRIDESLAMYSGALERATSTKERVGYLYEMASLLGQSGRTSESDDLLQQLTLLDPYHSSAWTGLGNNAWSTGRFDDAAAYYRKALQLNPGNREAAINLNALSTGRSGGR
ncbi:MAG: tetratricopeptide repeat protein [Betaproteobacteria bacterium]|nr:tetratricopeptide repeat protein [Betaproteobacteria bacterium]